MISRTKSFFKRKKNASPVATLARNALSATLPVPSTTLTRAAVETPLVKTNDSAGLNRTIMAPAGPASSDETESSLIDYQNAKETSSYLGEIINTTSQSRHKKAMVSTSMATNILNPPTSFKDDSGETDTEVEQNSNVDDDDYDDKGTILFSTGSYEAKRSQSLKLRSGFHSKNVHESKNRFSPEIDQGITRSYESDLDPKIEDRNSSSTPSSSSHHGAFKGDTEWKDHRTASASSSARDDEVKMLKLLVYKLNVELDRYQRKFRPLTSSEKHSVHGLPLKGPKPSWLVNVKQLAPLLMCYDEKLKEQNDLIGRFKAEMEKFKDEMEEVILENNRLHIQIEISSKDNEVPMNKMKELKLHCSLVLEENQLLLKQLNLEKEKFKRSFQDYSNQASNLTKKLASETVEKEKLIFENSELNKRLSDLKEKYESNLNSEFSKVTREEHDKVVARLQEDLKSCQLMNSSMLDDANTKMKDLEEDRQNVARDCKKWRDEAIKLQSIVAKNKKNEKRIKTNLNLLKSTTKREMADSDGGFGRYLSSVLEAAELTAKERDALLVEKMKKHDKDNNSIFGHFARDASELSGIKVKVKKSSILKKNREFSLLEKRLEDSNNTTKEQRETYEKQITNLKSLLEEKNNVIRNVSEQNRDIMQNLDNLNEIASRDNKILREAVGTVQATTFNVGFRADEYVHDVRSRRSTDQILNNHGRRCVCYSDEKRSKESCVCDELTVCS